MLGADHQDIARRTLKCLPFVTYHVRLWHEKNNKSCNRILLIIWNNSYVVISSIYSVFNSAFLWTVRSLRWFLSHDHSNLQAKTFKHKWQIRCIKLFEGIKKGEFEMHLTKYKSWLLEYIYITHLTNQEITIYLGQ